MTSLPMLVAEELDVDWTQGASIELAPADEGYGNPLFGGQQLTGGSTSVRGSGSCCGGWRSRARDAVSAAAQTWGVDRSTVSRGKVAVIHGAEQAPADLRRAGGQGRGVARAGRGFLEGSQGFKSSAQRSPGWTRPPRWMAARIRDRRPLPGMLVAGGALPGVRRQARASTRRRRKPCPASSTSCRSPAASQWSRPLLARQAGRGTPSTSPGPKGPAPE